ncbi:helix-turn-helix domain-containing protein [Actinomarinicola tropica]|uniref:DNA-binding response regulator n=1 Tax=Actinomarinicola tropica TaxID=2789776 RepID=A0A5Q2RN35_9ACTN|nr:response regulator transcription factor [Actinomarinicola tropica]QGG96362.1 hypothetical protein GH723_15350 [Actinomarinicola tropica]
MHATIPTPTVLVVAPADASPALVEAVEGEGIQVRSATPDELDGALTEAAVDVVVVVSGPEGLAAVARVARTTPATRYLAVADDLDPAAALDAGIGGVVAASAPPDVVRSAVRGLALGEGFLDAPLAREVLERHRREGIALTATEEEVLGRLARGDAAATIADDYAVTARLVRLHAGGALSRLLPT